MARATFDAVIDKVLAHEGGFVNHPKDPGGATNKGITLKTFQQWRRLQGRPTPRVDDLRKITTAEVKAIYRRQYWDSVKGDDLPAGIDYLALDYAINSGPGRAIKDLQKVLRVKADGVMGAETLDAIDREAHKDELDFVERYAAMRLAFMKSLKIWSTFGKGWSVRVADVKKNGLQLAKNDPLYGVTYVAGGNAKALDTQKKFTASLTSNVRSASASAGGVSGIGAAATDLAQQLEPLRYNEGLQVVQYLFIALMFVGFAISAYSIWKRLDDKNEARAMTDYELDVMDLEEVGEPA